MLNKLYDLEGLAPGTLAAAGVATLTAALVLLVMGWPWRRPDRVRQTLGWALGVGPGFALSCLVVGISPLSSQWNYTHRLLVVLLPAAVLVECLAAVPRVPKVLAWALRLGLAGAVARVTLHGSVYLVDNFGPGSSEWSAGEARAWLAGLAAALFVVWVALALLAEKAPGRSLPLALAVVCAGAGLTILLSGHTSGWSLGLSLGGALVGAAAGSLALAKPEGVRAALGVALVVLSALLVAGRFLNELTTLHAAALLFAPLLGWLPELPGVRRLPPWQRGVLRVALVLVPVAVVVSRAYQKSEEIRRERESAGYSGAHRSRPDARPHAEAAVLIPGRPVTLDRALRRHRRSVQGRPALDREVMQPAEDQDQLGGRVQEVDGRDDALGHVNDVHQHEHDRAAHGQHDDFRRVGAPPGCDQEDRPLDQHQAADRLDQPALHLGAGHGLETIKAQQRPDAGEEVVQTLHREDRGEADLDAVPHAR